MIDEQKVYEEFEEALLIALETYVPGKVLSYEALTIFIEDRVWESTLKYNRMINITRQKFFENLYKETTLDEYTKGIVDLWNIDHSYMNEAIDELRNMVIQRDFYNAEMYGDKKITKHSIKLQNNWEEYKLIDKELYRLNPESDFRKLEQRYVNRHIKLYENLLKRYKDAKDRGKVLAEYMDQYEKMDRTIPYFSHKTGEIIRHVDISTYENMLYNVNLTRSAWNREIYDAKLLGNHMWYLPAHPLACPGCMVYQGYVYTDHKPTPSEMAILDIYGKDGCPYKEDAIEDKLDAGVGIGHPNCKHLWMSYWSEEQIQDTKYSSGEWKEKYKTKQKIQSLNLEKSRLLTNRRIYKELGQQDLVDKTTEKIKKIREKIKELE